MTWLSEQVRNRTGVSLQGGRMYNLLETVEVDFAATAAKHRQVVEAFTKRHRERNGGKPLVVISHDGTARPEVHMDMETLLTLMVAAVTNNEAHWARPWVPRKDTDEGANR